MINKLTKKQAGLLPVYREKWLRIGLNTEQVTFDEATNIRDCVERLLNGKYPLTILMDSPLSAWVVVCMLSKQVGEQVEAQVWRQVRGQVGRHVRGQVGRQVWDFVWPYLDGHFDASFFAYYDYCGSVLGLPAYPSLWTDYIATTRVGLIYPLKNGIIIMCNRPTVIKTQNGQLHCEDGPAIAYADGFFVFILNGVRVPRTLVMTPAEELNPEIILSEKNVEVRREMVRKIGIDRVVRGLGATVIDSWAMTPSNVYELLSFKMPHSSVIAKYLKMQNPSTGTYHVEGVAPEITTVKEALNWRINGNDWEQVEALS